MATTYASRTYRAYPEKNKRLATGVILKEGSFYQVYPQRKTYYNLYVWQDEIRALYPQAEFAGQEAEYYERIHKSSFLSAQRRQIYEKRLTEYGRRLALCPRILIAPPPPPLPLPLPLSSPITDEPKQVYLVTSIFRAHSSGSESRHDQVCHSLEGVSKVLLKFYDNWCLDYNYPEEWDQEDMHVPFPSRQTFSLAAIQKVSARLHPGKLWKQVELWGPESDFEAQKPVEILLKLADLHA